MYTNEELIERFLYLIDANAEFIKYFESLENKKTDRGYVHYCESIKNSTNCLREIFNELKKCK